MLKSTIFADILLRDHHIFVLADSSCVYRNGYVVLTVPLPSRNEDCEFTFLPVSNTVKTVLSNIQDEDKGVDRVAIYSMDGNRVSNSTPVDILMQNNFKIIVNDKSYDIVTPKPGIYLSSVEMCFKVYCV